MTEIFPTLEQFFVHKVGEAAFDASIAKTWEKIIFFLEKIWTVSTFGHGEKLRPFVNKTWAEMSKLHLHDTENIMMKMLFLD